MTLFKKAVRPFVKQAKEVIAEELVESKPAKPTEVKTEVVKDEKWTKEDKLTVACIALGVLALLAFRSTPKVKVYIVK